MNEGLPATLQPRRSSASFLDPVPRSMPLSLSITRSPLFLLSLSLPVLSFSRFLSRQSCPDPRFFSPRLQQLQEPAKRDTTAPSLPLRRRDGGRNEAEESPSAVHAASLILLLLQLKSEEVQCPPFTPVHFSSQRPRQSLGPLSLLGIWEIKAENSGRTSLNGCIHVGKVCLLHSTPPFADVTVPRRMEGGIYDISHLQRSVR